jgi:SNF2-related domain
MSNGQNSFDLFGNLPYTSTEQSFLPSTNLQHNVWDDFGLNSHYRQNNAGNLPQPLTIDLSHTDDSAEDVPTPASSSSSDLVEISPEQFKSSDRHVINHRDATNIIRARVRPPDARHTPMQHQMMQTIPQRQNWNMAPLAGNMLPFRSHHSNDSRATPHFHPTQPLVQLPTMHMNSMSTFAGSMANIFSNALAGASNMAASLGSQHNPLTVDNHRPNPVYPVATVTRNDDTMALVRNIRTEDEMPESERMHTPETMAAQLLPHQRVGLSWMMKQEQSSNKGGILADDMGLGKTIQALALILAHKSEDPLNKTTLIIAPLALLEQWKNEMIEKVKPDHRLKIHIYHNHGKKVTYEQLRACDVVLTTFGTLSAEYRSKYGTNVRGRSTPRQPINLDTSRVTLIDDESKWYR